MIGDRYYYHRLDEKNQFIYRLILKVATDYVSLITSKDPKTYSQNALTAINNAIVSRRTLRAGVCPDIVLKSTPRLVPGIHRKKEEDLRVPRKKAKLLRSHKSQQLVFFG